MRLCFCQPSQYLGLLLVINKQHTRVVLQLRHLPHPLVCHQPAAKDNRVALCVAFHVARPGPLFGCIDER